MEPSNPWLHQCLVRFFKGVSDSQDLPEAVRTVLKQEISRLFGESDPKSYNKNYLSQHSNSIPHRLAAARMMFYLDSSSDKMACELATALDESLTGRSVRVCTEVLQVLRDGGLGESQQKAAESYRATCHKLYPYTLAFMPPGYEDNATVSANGDLSAGEHDEMANDM